MFRAGVIALIIIFLQVATFACDWKNISPSFFKALNTESNGMLSCQTTRDNSQEKIATINCTHNKSYFVFYNNNTVYMPTVSSSKNLVLTKCWREGSINQSCEVVVSPVKCQSWNLNTN